MKLSRPLPFKLSPRLQALLQELKPGVPVWDLCCDHGYLGLAAWNLGIYPEVHFVDQVEPLIRRLKARAFSLPAAPLFFHPVPAQTLPWDQLAGNVIISGVGSRTCIEIVSRIPVTERFELVLSPQKDPQVLRRWLDRHGWRLVRDQVLIESGRFRQILKVAAVGERIHPFGNDLFGSSCGPEYSRFLRNHSVATMQKSERR